MEKEVKERIFVVGAPRSGTTLMQCLLAAHSQITSFPETHYFRRVFSDRFLLSMFGIASPRARENWYSFIDLIGLDRRRYHLPFYIFLASQFAYKFVDVLDTLTLERGKTIWLEKTPGHLHYIPQIERLIKNAKFIHILRGGTDVIASLYEISQKYDDPWGIELRSLERCIEIWAEDTRLDMQYFGKPNHYLVKYEQMTADSRSVVVDLCRFLNIPFEEQMLTDYSSVVSQLVTKNEPWKATVGTPIEKRQGHKFYSLFTPEQQQYILEHIPKDIDYESLLEH